ncbi:MAG: hypothetical protein SR1Q5_03305 [Quinella sp. 1Q5]|nr:hypothetical protein [Quinella sp. 1Q5]
MKFLKSGTDYINWSHVRAIRVVAAMILFEVDNVEFPLDEVFLSIKAAQEHLDNLIDEVEKSTALRFVAVENGYVNAAFVRRFFIHGTQLRFETDLGQQYLFDDFADDCSAQAYLEGLIKELEE